jgi:hypothetical protein
LAISLSYITPPTLQVSPSGRLEDAVVVAAADGGGTLLIALRRRTPTLDSNLQHPAPVRIS